MSTCRDLMTKNPVWCLPTDTMQRMTDAGMIAYDVIRSGTFNVGQHFKTLG
jgi:hypothetical protein